MAYLKPATLTCPNCDFRSRVVWVIGVGPNSTPGKPPYRKLQKVGEFVRDPSNRTAVSCPKCKGKVL